MKNRIVFITSLTLWSMGKGQGGPAFTKTIKKYIEEGWEVFLISDEASNKEYPYLDDKHNIVVTESVFKKYIGKRRVGVIFRILDQLVAKNKICKAVKKQIVGKTNQTIIYSYEVGRFLAAKSIAEKYCLPLVTRFQGTNLVRVKKHNFRTIVATFPAYQALKYKSDLLIMTNDGTQGDRILKELNNYGSNVLFLRNGVGLMSEDIETMKKDFERNKFRENLGITKSDTCFLTVSRLVKWKRIDRSINGLAKLREVNSTAKLIVVGDGENRTEYEKLSEKLKIREHVIFIGAVPQEKVYKYMMACDVFLSLYDLSNVGNPLLEAMSLGKAIITLDVGDTKKLICNNETGKLLNIDEVDHLHEIMLELIEDSNLKAYLGEKASRFAEENFSTWSERMQIEFDEVSKLFANKSRRN